MVHIGTTWMHRLKSYEVEDLMALPWYSPHNIEQSIVFIYRIPSAPTFYTYELTITRPKADPYKYHFLALEAYWPSIADIVNVWTVTSEFSRKKNNNKHTYFSNPWLIFTFFLSSNKIWKIVQKRRTVCKHFAGLSG